MSAWDIATWLAIAVLVLGAAAVFVWFLRDAVAVYRSIGGEEDSADSGS